MLKKLMSMFLGLALIVSTTSCRTLEFIKNLGGGASYAYLVKDLSTRELYVFKQNRETGIQLYRDAIMEYTWSKVALLLGIKTNRVDIVGDETSIISSLSTDEKPHKNKLGTLHTFITAKDSYEGPVENVDLHGDWSAWLFEKMLKRNDLAVITALDLISGNPDRHSGNLLYDDLNDQYVAIDFGYASRQERTIDAYKFFKHLAHDKNLAMLSSSQKLNLTAFIHTMKELYSMLTRKIVAGFLQEALNKAIDHGLEMDQAWILHELFSLQLTLAERKAAKIINFAEKLHADAKTSDECPYQASHVLRNNVVTSSARLSFISSRL